jgi:hypothetical protein
MRAGITAAAGTRLALSWVLTESFTFGPFQCPTSKRTGLLFLVTISFK